jgi:3-oxoacyl-[acyl-carrier protein] reductase
LGFGVAKALAAEGVRVAICGRDRERMQAAAQVIGSGAVPLVADVSTASGGREFVHAAAEALGGIDILVPNAGGPPAGGAADTAVEAFRDALELNVLSTIAMCQAALPGMRAQRWGRIVAITSITARQPMDNMALSNTSRPAVTGYLKTLALEVAPYGITVNSVQPGMHRTTRLTHLGTDADPAASGIRTGRFGDPDDFGALVAMLCSEQARYAVGVHLPLDGGSFIGLQ